MKHHHSHLVQGNLLGGGASLSERILWGCHKVGLKIPFGKSSVGMAGEILMEPVLCSATTQAPQRTRAHIQNAGFHRLAASCSILQYLAASCSVLQRLAASCETPTPPRPKTRQEQGREGSQMGACFVGCFRPKACLRFWRLQGPSLRRLPVMASLRGTEQPSHASSSEDTRVRTRSAGCLAVDHCIEARSELGAIWSSVMTRSSHISHHNSHDVTSNSEQTPVVLATPYG